MEERFGKDYFYGRKKSNYSNYERLDPSKQFGGVISFIKKSRPGGRFLDAGCAFGLLLREVSPFFNELYGCDISAFAVKKARQNMPRADIIIANLEEALPYRDSMFDCIAVLDVLEHMRSFEKGFANLVKKLKRGGYMILSSPVNGRMRRVFDFLDKDKTHISVLPEAEIVRIAKKHKMQIIRKRHFCPFPIFYRIPYIPAEVEIILEKTAY